MSDETSDARMAGIVTQAVKQFQALTGKPPDSVTGVRKDGDGWSVLVDVIELDRIPTTTSVIAIYRVDVDSKGELVGYERLRRFHRGTVDPS